MNFTKESIQQFDIFKEFDAITKIPRPSFHEERISEYLYQWAKERELEVYRDEYNNILIKKPATPGYEEAKPVILQAHMDMVAEANPEIEHDFLTDPIEYFVDGDSISTHNRTTLGADNGIGIALALAILNAKDLSHPALELVVTTAEEEDFSGADNFDASELQGKYMINVDHCVDTEILCASAGGIAVRSSCPVTTEAPISDVGFQVLINGLVGGHSGEDIHRGRGNAIILLHRFLHSIKDLPYAVTDISGGKFRLAIPRYASVTLRLPGEYEERFREALKAFQQMLREEYLPFEDARIEAKAVVFADEPTISRELTDRLTLFVLTSPNEVQFMSNVFPGQVDASCNLGELFIEDGEIVILNDIRTSYGSQSDFIADKVLILSTAFGFEGSTFMRYDSWKYEPNSILRKVAAQSIEKICGTEAKVIALHAGLECGFFKKKLPELDIISIGPNAFDFHSPKEHLSISSTLRSYEILKDILENMK